MKLRNPVGFGPGQVSFWTTVVYIAIVASLIFVHENVPGAPRDASLPRGLNLTEAWADLQFITSHYHPYNSRANDGVRTYLIDRSEAILRRNEIQYGIERPSADVTLDNVPGYESQNAASYPVTLFDDNLSNFTRTQEAPVWVQTAGTYFEGNNFYVYIRGTEDPAGAWWEDVPSAQAVQDAAGVLVNCHFDSVSTGFGATDDGMGCVSILQLLSYFTTEGRQPKNGIFLLFNNAEEDGLLGANAFAQRPVSNFIHTFVNLEGAGAGGRAVLFRATDLEIAEAYAQSPHPFGSVVAADAFERGVIRSGTDYSVFKDVIGQRGMDIAFYGPRARYHTDQDDARHASVHSIWHMLSAALASTEQLSKTTSTKFMGDRADGDDTKVHNGKPTRGIWFDLYGQAWAAMPLKGLFAWSLTLLVATPLILILVSYLLARSDRYYFFARDIKNASELSDEPIRIGGWKGLFRFPLAFVFAGALTVGSALLLAKFNPLIIYSSPYAVWAMFVSLFYFASWLILRGASFVRPSALQRGFAIFWLYILGWALQVLAAVAEDRLKIGSMYSMAFLQTAIFLALLISLLELSALPKKQEFAQQLSDADQSYRWETSGNDDTRQQNDDEGREDRDDGDTATETTPLRAGEQSYGTGNETTSFAGTYRRSVSADASVPPIVKEARPYGKEQLWSGHLPQWTWFLQFLLMVPIPLIIIGNLGLVSMTAMDMTGVDGSSLHAPLMTSAVITIFLLVPVAPFIHRVTHHLPVFLLVVFAGTLIYNLVAFPFSIESRFKFFFQQVIDIDEGTDVVRLSGIEEYVRPIIASLPSAAGQEITCGKEDGNRAGVFVCDYDASSLTPNLVEGKEVDELISFETTGRDGSSVSFSLDALDTRTCVLHFSQAVYDFSVAGGAPRDERLGSLPEAGLRSLDLWRRSWEGAWNVTLDLGDETRDAETVSQDVPSQDLPDDPMDELRMRSDASAGPPEVTVACKWSDANDPETVPALHELRQYMPSWAAVTKRQVGLVEVRKKFKLAG